MSKVVIGSKYHRERFVVCNIGRDYAALNPPLCNDSLKLQGQLLGDGLADAGTSNWKSWILYGVALVLALAAFGIWLDR